MVLNNQKNYNIKKAWQNKMQYKVHGLPRGGGKTLFFFFLKSEFLKEKLLQSLRALIVKSPVSLSLPARTLQQPRGPCLQTSGCKTEHEG